MAKVNQACSDASYLRIMAGSILVSLLFSFLPLVGFVAMIGFYFLLVAVPIMMIRWWVKFGSLTSDDRDWVRAKRTVLVATGIWSIFLIFLVVRFAA